MRKQIVAANWKMNKTFSEFKNFIDEFLINNNLQTADKVDILICPSFIYLKEMNELFANKKVKVGAQNLAEFEEGAYTGEISASMLNSLNINYCIIGHSERRKFFNENYIQLKNKVDIAIKFNINPIFCCGEVKEERLNNEQYLIVEEQLKSSLFHLSETDILKCIIAYEPAWAIGTGLNASPEEAQDMHNFIRNLISQKYNQTIANQIRIIYGGSCNSKNAKEIFSKPDVDGGLVGGASLKVDEFVNIIMSCK